jgi:prepilin-type N-terminal cleavage/methylation domain-containing protein
MRPGAARHDDGFTLIETLVSLAVIGIVAASCAVFLIGANRISGRASVQDTAAQIAIGGMERARGMRGAALLAGRAECDGAHPCDPPVSGTVSAYLGSLPQRWDAAAAGGTPVLPLPSSPEVVELDGLRYHRYYYLARCWQTAASDGSTGSRPCTVAAAGSAHPAEYVRLVIAVTWPGPGIYVASTLMSSSPVDPYLEG